ncbi:glucan biosynthesis protein [bacterium]|nr:MAG: glucan biosynthesis protein [bacterium]
METIVSAWKRIAAWYDANTPEGTLVLAPGASEEEIVHLENTIGFRLPDDLRASFAVHNGVTNEAFLLYHGELLSLKGVLQEHQGRLQWQREDGYGVGPDYEPRDIESSSPIKPVFWNPLRLPLTDNSGNAVMSDFDPAPGGQWGQIIAFDHEVGPQRVLGPSFGQWLTSLAEGLENGEYTWIEEEGQVGPLED